MSPASTRAPKLLRIDTSHTGTTYKKYFLNVWIFFKIFKMVYFRGKEAIIKFDTTLGFQAPLYARFLR